MSMKFINPEDQVSRSKNKKVIKVCFGTRSSGTPCKFLGCFYILIKFHSALVDSNKDFTECWLRMCG